MSSIFTGFLVLLLGPSGVGKGTTVTLLKKKHPKWIFPVSATTRKPRPTEKSGEAYHFFSMDEFDEKIKRNEFIEWAWVHGKQKYGMLKSEIFPFLKQGKIVLREVDIQGFLDARKIVPAENLISVFLLPPSKEILVQRIRNRAPITHEELEERLKSMDREMGYSHECNYQIQTKDGDKEFPVREVEKIIMKTGRFLTSVKS